MPIAEAFTVKAIEHYYIAFVHLMSTSFLLSTKSTYSEIFFLFRLLVLIFVMHLGKKSILISRFTATLQKFGTPISSLLHNYLI